MDSKSLRTIVSETAQLETMLIESNGEITPEIEAALSVKEINLPQKVDNYSMVIDRMESVSKFYYEKAKIFMQMSKSAESVSERCKANMKFAMQELKVTELVGNDIKFKLVKSNPAVVINDENEVDGSYKITKTTTSVDKKRIADDLKLGIPVKGAELQQNQSLRVYANTEGK